MSSLDQETARLVDEWREHPNYGKVCECEHHAIMHQDGVGKCSGVETVVVAKKFKDCRFKHCECRAVRLPDGAKEKA